MPPKIAYPEKAWQQVSAVLVSDVIMQVPAIILRSQIYDVLHDWSQVDRELEEERFAPPVFTHGYTPLSICHELLTSRPRGGWGGGRSYYHADLSLLSALLKEPSEYRQKGSVRMIKLPASVDDYAYILTEDYVGCVEAAACSQKVAPLQSHSSAFKLLPN